jgi:alpha-glucuronidase
MNSKLKLPGKHNAVVIQVKNSPIQDADDSIDNPISPLYRKPSKREQVKQKMLEKKPTNFQSQTHYLASCTEEP